MSERVEPMIRKARGAYYTPDLVATTLVGWAVRSQRERLLDPSCGDGRFIAAHRNSVGIEQDPLAARQAIERSPSSLVHEGDFFTWAMGTRERFDAVCGNPPFIRYQTFKGEIREKALHLCRRLGVSFNGLASSWAPFLVAAAGLLKPCGKMAFVVPAEIGHAPYAGPLMDFLAASFEVVHLIAYKKKLFPELSEDCWLLYAEGVGLPTNNFRFTVAEEFEYSARPPEDFIEIPVNEWREKWNRRLRPFLLPSKLLKTYEGLAFQPQNKRLKDFARVGIGYVSGANDFFHLRPSSAENLQIPSGYLRPTVRKASVLPSNRLTEATLSSWRKNDDAFLLLSLPKTEKTLPKSIQRYLDSEEGYEVRGGFKCRNREPWYSVPDVKTPDYFLSYMSGVTPLLVRNEADCTCTNSLHGVTLYDQKYSAHINSVWKSSLVQLSCELEGHPLGGGMLKLEPNEAAQILIPQTRTVTPSVDNSLAEAIEIMRSWRHYAAPE